MNRPYFVRIGLSRCINLNHVTYVDATNTEEIKLTVIGFGCTVKIEPAYSQIFLNTFDKFIS